jgi:hypothetical protein
MRSDTTALCVLPQVLHTAQKHNSLAESGSGISDVNGDVLSTKPALDHKSGGKTV